MVRRGSEGRAEAEAAPEIPGDPEEGMAPGKGTGTDMEKVATVAERDMEVSETTETAMEDLSNW